MVGSMDWRSTKVGDLPGPQMLEGMRQVVVLAWDEIIEVGAGPGDDKLAD